MNETTRRARRLQDHLEGTFARAKHEIDCGNVESGIDLFCTGLAKLLNGAGDSPLDSEFVKGLGISPFGEPHRSDKPRPRHVVLSACLMSRRAGLPVPEWAHEELAQLCEQFYRHGPDFDFNRYFGLVGREGRLSPHEEEQRAVRKYARACCLGILIDANGLRGRRKIAKGALWDFIAEKYGLTSSHLQNEWSRELKDMYADSRDGNPDLTLITGLRELRRISENRKTKS